LRSFEAQLYPCAFPYAFKTADLYPDRIATRPNTACNGSSNSSHNRRPASIARSGSSGTLLIPWMAAISLCRKSRMKNDRDSRTRPSISALRTVLGILIGIRLLDRLHWDTPEPPPATLRDTAAPLYLSVACAE
jgi:hypothetical protein